MNTPEEPWLERDGPSTARFVCGELIDISTWHTPDEGSLIGDRLSMYLRRKRAVTLYLNGAAPEVITQEVGLTANGVYRLIRRRCLPTHEDGLPYGWRGLVPWVRQKKYDRVAPIREFLGGRGGAGAFMQLLKREPGLKEEFDKRILRSALTSATSQLKVSRYSRRDQTNWLLNQLRSRGYEAKGLWPFCTSSCGYSTVCRYIAQVLAQNPKVLAATVGGPNLVAKLKSGDGSRRPVMHFMQRVEMDAHKLDTRICLCVPLPGGGFKQYVVHRLWVVVILEVMSRAVLGYCLSTRIEIGKDDVMRAIKVALSASALPKVTYSQEAYAPGAGLLSSLGPSYIGLCWDETSVDGALAETSPSIELALREAIGSVLIAPNVGRSFSVRRAKDDRPFIERFFRTIENSYFHRLSNTTGPKQDTRKGTTPEEVAINSRFQFEYLVELLAVAIGNYNVSAHSGIGGQSPLEYAKYLYENSELAIRRADPSVVQSLFCTRKHCTVHGGAKKGRAPYVQFCNAQYTNEVLQNRHDLVGKKIWVTAHLDDDCRVAMASTLDGKSLGILRAAPPWNASPHSLAVRAAVVKASTKNLPSLLRGDAVENFVKHCESHSRHKLPVHPTYLEIRRIQEEALTASVGDELLTRALTRIGAASDTTSDENTPEPHRFLGASFESDERNTNRRELPPWRKPQIR